ncbi:MAG: peptidase, partial [Acidimicrobiaceae bacterium]|nr:peptidase [Acidimicrobiaceae bacterium]
WAAAGELESAGELLRSWASSRALAGVNAELVRLPGRTPVLWVEVPATDPERAETTTLLYGHFDKQPPLGEWRTGLDPFRAVREGDCLYGRGTADDGYATPAALLALEALAATGTRHGRCVLLAEASEESGSPDLGAYLEHLADRIGRPDLVLCLDSGGPSYDCMWVTSSLRGNLVGTLSVQVLDEGVHSGAAGGVVPSSFRLLRSLLSRVEDERTGELLLAELHVETPAHRRREIEEVAAELGEAAPGLFPTVPGLMLSGSDPADRLERVTWGPALAVTGAAGLPALADAGNVLRPFTAVKLSFRLPPTCDAARAAAALERVLTADPPSRATVRFELEAPADGWDAPEPASWLAGAARSASLAYFGAPPRHVGLGGSIPFMADLGKRYPGVQFLATGVLGPASNAHGPNEALHVPTAKAITAAIAHVVASVPAYVH